MYQAVQLSTGQAAVMLCGCGCNQQARQKVMAAYAGWLTACTPGSAPGTTLGNEYGKPSPFFLTLLDTWHVIIRLVACFVFQIYSGA